MTDIVETFVSPADLTGSVAPLVASLLLAISILLAIWCYSLRNFSRSRLADLCRARGNEDRFGLILKQDETALALCEVLEWGTSCVGVALLAAWRYQGVVPSWQPVIDLVGLVCGAFVALMILPWSLSRVYGEQVLFRSWPLISMCTTLLRPLSHVMHRVDTLVHRIAGRQDPVPETVETLADELQSVVDEGEREGLLESRAGRILQRVMELREDDVRAVMTPRTDIVFVPVDAGLQEARRIILDSGHSRLPVIGQSPDDIVGILYARDLLSEFGNGETSSALSGLVHEPCYVPETTTIDDLLERMKRERLHMAIVLDEYGGVTGLVTMEDILEEIVGDIQDEFDEAQEEQIRHVDESTVDVDGRVHLDDLNERFGYDLPEDADFDTVGGFAFSELGRVPEPGESFTWRNLRITILEADKRKIIMLRIQTDQSLILAHEEV